MEVCCFSLHPTKAAVTQPAKSSNVGNAINHPIWGTIYGDLGDGLLWFYPHYVRILQQLVPHCRISSRYTKQPPDVTGSPALISPLERDLPRWQVYW